MFEKRPPEAVLSDRFDRSSKEHSSDNCRNSIRDDGIVINEGFRNLLGAHLFELVFRVI